MVGDGPDDISHMPPTSSTMTGLARVSTTGLFLIGWITLGFLFTFLLWPFIAKRLDEDYPKVNSNGTDNL